MGESFTAAANGNNQLVGYSYDTSGNLQNDLLGHSFVYDAENRPYAAGGVTYYYDGAGERAAKSNGKLYWFGTGSAPVAESDASGSLTNEYIFFDGHRVAMKRMSDATVHYYFADQIGSANVVTNATGAMPPEQDIEYHPYGEQIVNIDTLGQEYRFTDKEHDPETNNDYFGARYYSSTMGRFLTPDWSAAPVPIPYAVMGNPQTLNLYSYVENNPITGTDPDGHYNCNGTVSNSPCPGQNQAPDVRQDAKAAKKEAAKKKQEQEKQIAQLKELKEKAAATLKAIGGKMEDGSRWLNDHPIVILGLTLGMSVASWEKAEPAVEEEMESAKGAVEEELESASSTLEKAWSATKNMSAGENAAEHAAKHAGDFGLSESEYIQAAQKFVQNPPQGVLTKIRPNGDTLLYSPTTNTFAVRAASGAPRTMFRPTDGINYWNKQ